MPPRKSTKTELLSGTIDLKKLCYRRDNPCGCPLFQNCILCPYTTCILSYYTMQIAPAAKQQINGYKQLYFYIIS